MPGITQQTLKKHIADKSFDRLYLLFGEEKYTLKRAAERLIEKCSAGPFPQFNLAEFTGEADIDGILSALEALPFMAERKCVAVSDLDPGAKSSEELARLLEAMDDLPDSVTLVLYYPTMDFPRKSPPSGWKKLLDMAGKAGCAVDFPKLEKPDLYRLLKKEAGRQGCELPTGSWNRLFDYTGDDLNALMRELEKLCAYTLGTGGTEISPKTVELITPKSTETTVFVMIRAISAGRGDEAYSQLDMLLSRREEPVMVLGAIAGAYVDMYRVKAALEAGLNSSAPAEYAPEYKGRGAYRLQTAERAARRLSAAGIRQSLELLMEADMALKGSRMEPRLVLEELLTRLMLVVSR